MKFPAEILLIPREIDAEPAENHREGISSLNTGSKDMPAESTDQTYISLY